MGGNTSLALGGCIAVLTRSFTRLTLRITIVEEAHWTRRNTIIVVEYIGRIT